MDGATIKLLITGDDGRTPLPPLPAYQQIIKGMPARATRSRSSATTPTTCSRTSSTACRRVEQVLVTIRMAIERAMSQLGYYTEGTTPDGFMELPKDFTLEQVQQWTEWFNSELEGQTGERRKIRFVPQDSKYVPTKTEILKDAVRRVARADHLLQLLAVAAGARQGDEPRDRGDGEAGRAGRRARADEALVQGRDGRRARCARRLRRSRMAVGRRGDRRPASQAQVVIVLPRRDRRRSR
jgi:hypothetical protein